jgi:hypothetical protein
MLGIESHSAVWNAYKVEILDSKDDWSEVKIVEGPKKDRGWIPTSCIERTRPAIDTEASLQ